MFKPNSLFYTDGYKIGHKRMLAEGTDFLYGTWIPRSIKHAPKSIEKIVSFGHQLTWTWINDEFQENFFNQPRNTASQFGQDMSLYLGLPFDANHFKELHALGYLPIRVKALPEGIETLPNIPHMTFVNTEKGFAWLTLYLETIVSSLAWKPATSATIALKYRRTALEWVEKTDPANLWLVDYMCHDFSARGLSPWDMISSGLGHATSHRGSDTIICIPAARYFYGEPDTEVCINSVNASEHSVSTTKIFTVGEKQMLSDWLKEFPIGILSVVSDTFDLWKLITEYLPILKDEIMSRDGKMVIRPDSGNPVDIICGTQFLAPSLSWLTKNVAGVAYENWYYMDGDVEMQHHATDGEYKRTPKPSDIGVIELLWNIFGGTTNDKGYKVLDPHIGAIYGDSINPERQVEIYRRLEAKGFASTNIVLGVGSFTYQFNTRDTFGFAAKGSWFEANGIPYNIYKDPATDDGTKKSLKGLMRVYDDNGTIKVKEECSWNEENEGLLQVIFEDGKFSNLTSLTKIREVLKNGR